MKNRTLSEVEHLLLACEDDLTWLQTLGQQLIDTENRIAQLKDYYQHQYMKDVDQHHAEDTLSRVLDQDSIWNVISDQHLEKMKILKQIIQSIPTD